MKIINIVGGLIIVYIINLAVFAGITFLVLSAISFIEWDIRFAKELIADAIRASSVLALVAEFIMLYLDWPGFVDVFNSDDLVSESFFD